jgi:hypothetical protein
VSRSASCSSLNVKSTVGFPRRQRAGDGRTSLTALVTVDGHPFEIALPSNPLGPCTLNGSQLLSRSGGNFEHIHVQAHHAGVFVLDINAAVRACCSISKTSPTSRPSISSRWIGGHIIQANRDALGALGLTPPSQPCRGTARSSGDGGGLV